MTDKHRIGFTLIELSIVLAIIGLLVGGVAAGKELVRAAKVRQQISQFQQYDQAVAVFKGKYGSLPGDITDAKANSFGFVTSGGNNDGFVSDSEIPPSSLWTEPLLFFDQLYSAKLIANPKTDAPISGMYVLGYDFPRAKLGGGLMAGSMPDGGLFWFYAMAKNGSDRRIWDLVDAVVSPQDAYAIDSKIDDGKALTGKVYSAWTTGPAWYDQHAVADSDARANACITSVARNTYNVSSGAISCMLVVYSQ